MTGAAYYIRWWMCNCWKTNCIRTTLDMVFHLCNKWREWQQVIRTAYSIRSQICYCWTICCIETMRDTIWYLPVTIAESGNKWWELHIKSVYKYVIVEQYFLSELRLIWCFTCIIEENGNKWQELHIQSDDKYVIVEQYLIELPMIWCLLNNWRDWHKEW